MTADKPEVTLVVDGVEVRAVDGSMLVDAAKHGDVEIPVFCYEPKLGEPVGACRMCLVEIEGIPKLQTACSTPVRDGMVVYTQTDRVHEAQNAVVEFLLVNHPLDCPVCDKGGECPLQDISMGWGPGRSRVTDPKRHFQKPLPLSPLVRIDRERCILCYRCVRFSQEVAEDEQLQLLERGDRTYVGTFDDRPYIAPFHGNIIELCPVGALTSETYRFRARPWDIEAAGSVCTLCPSQCNVAFTVRDEQVKRVLGRDNLAVDDGWLCDKGRFSNQMLTDPDRITGPLVNDGGELRPASWAEAIERAAAGLGAAGSRSAAIAGGGTSNEEGYLIQRIVRRALGSPHVDSRPRGRLSRDVARAISRPQVSVPISGIDDAHTVVVLGADPLHEMPILDLRIRKAVRRNETRLLVASERPTGLDGGALESVRYAPGDAAAFVGALAAQVRGEEAEGPYAHDAGRIAAELSKRHNTIVVWGSRMIRGPAGSEVAGAGAVAELADALDLAAREGSGILEIPEEGNGRGLREVGCTPDAGPGLSAEPEGMSSEETRVALEAGDLSALLLANVDPIRDHPLGPEWAKALQAADFVVAIAMFENDSTKHADVVFPAESFAEKEGTVTHPDGRLQRVRPGVPHPGDIRHGWQVLVELSAALGHETGLNTQPEVLAALTSEVPFYAGITNEEIGGRGVRWQEREPASSARGEGVGMPPPEAGPAKVGESRSMASQRGRMEEGASSGGTPTPSPSNGDGIRIGTYRDLWSGEVTERNAALRFLAPKQTLEISPTDAERLGVAQGQEVVVSSNGTSLAARVAIRERMRPGAGFMIEGIENANANALAAAETVAVKPAEASE